MNLKQLKEALATLPEDYNDKEVYVTTPDTPDIFAYTINKFVRSHEDVLIIRCSNGICIMVSRSIRGTTMSVDAKADGEMALLAMTEVCDYLYDNNSWNSI